MDWKLVVRMVLPIVLREKAPQLSKYVDVIEKGMFQAEDLVHATGAEKLAHATDLIVTGFEAVNLAKGRVVVDPALVRSIGADAMSVTADVAKYIQMRTLPAQTTGTALPAPPPAGGL